MSRRRNKGEKSKSKYRSRFEEQFALLLNKLGVKFVYEAAPIMYTLDCKYFPDFHIGDMYIETKGIFDGADRRKHLAIKRQHPKKDIRFIFYKDSKISKISKTKYSDWCEKHGYKYFVGLGVPEEWLLEAINGKKSNAKKKRKTTKNS